VHPTLGSLARFQAFFYASAFSCSQAESTPAHPQVTQTVGRALCLLNLARASERVLSTREMANAIIVRI
jgi:DNA-binding transcriptional regulator YhcF (GntR family)